MLSVLASDRVVMCVRTLRIDSDPDEEAREALRNKVLHLISFSFDLTASLIFILNSSSAIRAGSQQQRAASRSTFYASGMGRWASNDRWWRQWQQQ
jgi:hypothetical protein